MGWKRISELGSGDLVAAGLSEEEASDLVKAIGDVVGGRGKGRPGSGDFDAREVWRELVDRRVMKPWYPHRVHQLMFYSVYADWDESAQGPPPYWFPSP